MENSSPHLDPKRDFRLTFFLQGAARDSDGPAREPLNCGHMAWSAMPISFRRHHSETRTHLHGRREAASISTLTIVASLTGSKAMPSELCSSTRTKSARSFQPVLFS